MLFWLFCKMFIKVILFLFLLLLIGFLSESWDKNFLFCFKYISILFLIYFAVYVESFVDLVLE